MLVSWYMIAGLCCKFRLRFKGREMTSLPSRVETWTFIVLTWWNTSSYVIDWKKGKITSLQRILSIKLWLQSTFLAATSAFCSHLYGDVVWLCLSRHKWFTLSRLCFLPQGQVRFVASSLCEGAQYVTGIIVNTNSQESPCAFPKLTSL